VARRTSAVAVDIAQKVNQRERGALFGAATAVSEAFYGNKSAARQRATEVLELARGREVDYAAAFALSLAGDMARSRALADDLAKSFPEDTSVQSIYLPTLRALFSLSAGDAAAALQSLQSASRFDLALGGIGFYGYFGVFIPSTFAAWRTSGQVNPPKRSPSSSGFSIIEASCSSIRWTRSRACTWHVRWRSQATP
jgi:hypothetical protein